MIKLIKCNHCGHNVKYDNSINKCSNCNKINWNYSNPSEHLIDNKFPNKKTTNLNKIETPNHKKNNTIVPPHTKFLPKSKKACLVIKENNKVVAIFALKKGENIIGRKRSNNITPDILIDNDQYISYNHATLIVQTDSSGYKYFIKDNNSLNGTYFSNTPFRIKEKKEVFIHNSFEVGRTKFFLKIK